MNVVTYARVSTKEQGDYGFSLSHQKAVLEQHCKINGGRIVKHFREDHSAKSFNRPAWSVLMKLLKQAPKTIDAVVFTRWDRFSRNMEEALATIRTLKQMGVKVISVEQPLDTSTPDYKVMLALYLSIPEVENDKNSIRTIEGQRAAQKEGCFVARAPFGYSRHRDANNKATLKPNKAAWIVEKGFKLFATGAHNMEEVRKIIKNDGYTGNKESFRLLLQRHVYRGKIEIKAYGNDEYQIVDGLHKPIVSDGIFFKVQDILNGRKKQNFKINKVNPELPLRGFLKCPKCGGKLTGSFSKGNGGKYGYYHCQHGCQQRYRSKKVNDDFLQYLGSLKFDPGVLMLYKEVITDIFNEKRVEREKEITRIISQQESIENMLQNLTDKYVNDKIERADYMKTKNRYKLNLAKLEKELLRLKNLDNSVDECFDEGIALLMDIKNLYEISGIYQKQIIVGSIFGKNLVYEDEKYRTSEMNSVLSLLVDFRDDFHLNNKKKVGKNTNLSNMAPPLGLEPRTY